MWGSGLGTSLSVFSPVVAAIVGGFIGAVATGLVATMRDRRIRNRERKGLLNLILFELNRNAVFMSTIDEVDSDKTRLMGELQDSIWIDTRVRLAQLIPVKELNVILGYYTVLEGLKIGIPADGVKPLTTVDQDGIQHLQKRYIQIQEIVGNY